MIDIDPTFKILESYKTDLKDCSASVFSTISDLCDLRFQEISYFEKDSVFFLYFSKNNVVSPKSRLMSVWVSLGRDHFGISLGSLRGQFWVSLGELWNHFGIAFGVTLGDPRNTQKVNMFGECGFLNIYPENMKIIWFFHFCVSPNRKGPSQREMPRVGPHKVASW